MNVAAQSLPRPSLAESLRNVHVGLRGEDLEVSRHVFRGVPCYIVRDPMTFQTQRLEVADYEVFVRIHAARPLSAIFSEQVDHGSLTAADEERSTSSYFRFTGWGFLQLPISDEKLLYRRYQQRRRLQRRNRLLGILFLRIPLWNPNAFLERTLRHVRFLYSKGCFCVWGLLLAAAFYVGAARWEELRQPLDGLLAARNLPLLWLTLIGLKVFHEFGHAYACRHYGGHVPEMGVYLILFTPCAYVDATASWGFTSKRERLVVCLAGMYVESIIASLAVFAWAATEPSVIHSLAYNVIFLAGVVTFPVQHQTPSCATTGTTSSAI